MHQLEGSQCGTELYLNMGNNMINILPHRKYIKIIVTKFAIFRYNRLLIGMCTSGDIIQSKVDVITGNIECVETYIDDIVVLIKDFF